MALIKVSTYVVLNLSDASTDNVIAEMIQGAILALKERNGCRCDIILPGRVILMEIVD